MVEGKKLHRERKKQKKSQTQNSIDSMGNVVCVVSRVCNLRLCAFNELQYNWEKLRRKKMKVFFMIAREQMAFVSFSFFFFCWDGIEIEKPLVVHSIWQNNMVHCARFKQMIRFVFFKTKKNHHDFWHSNCCANRQ